MEAMSSRCIACKFVRATGAREASIGDAVGVPTNGAANVCGIDFVAGRIIPTQNDVLPLPVREAKF